MEQITKQDGRYCYGERGCADIDEAYVLFRRDYHSTLGRDASRRLDRLGQRKERIHGFGFCFDDGAVSGFDAGAVGRVRYRLLGLVGIHYCRIIGCWDYAGVGDDEFDGWFDTVFRKGSGLLRMVGTDQKVGRTSKRLNKRYK